MIRTVFKRPVQIIASMLVVGGEFQMPAHAQSADGPLEATPAPPRSVGRNVARVDLLAPLASSIDYSLNSGKGLVFPVLVSYERQFGSRWSVGFEALVRGGTPANRRSGASLLGRWYVLPVGRSKPPLQGLYLSSVLSYRALSTTAGDFNLPVNSGKRAGGGLLLGWQVPPFPGILPNLVFDGAVGIVAWTRLGDDQTSDPGYYAYIGEPIFKRTGFLPDARYGLGYRF